MKPLFASAFVILTIAMSSVAIVADQDVYQSLSPLAVLSHITTKPNKDVLTKKGLAVPKPIGPQFPPQEELSARVTIRGQQASLSGDLSGLGGILDDPPPIPQGAADEGVIDQKLVTPIPELGLAGIDSVDTSLSANSVRNSAQTASSETKPADPLGNGILLVAIAITTAGLIYMAFVAYDYRQRWMQSLIVQNDRYLGGAFDRDMEEYEGHSAEWRNRQTLGI